MRKPVVGRPARASAILTTLAIAGTVGLSGLQGSAHARPPSGLLGVPDDAFRPVTVPDTTNPAIDAPPRVVARPPDGAIEPPHDEGPVQVPASPAEAPIELTPAPPTPRPSPPAGPIHVVRPGDTLVQIAAWHRVEVTSIVTWNPTADPRRLVSGQEILVPDGAPMPVVTPAPKVASKPAPEVASKPAPEVTSKPAPEAASNSASDQPSPAPASEPSGHLWPLPVKGTITTRFSAAHPGIDIAAPAGTTVRAIAPGTVVWAGWKNNGGGYVIVIEHPDGMTSTYNHNRRVNAQVGQVVDTGEQVAEVGATGNATGPHLDLRIEMGGRLLNPLRLDWER
ncbi:MAG: M23 family metallopeptidase [Chloroflexi bacterium]|nr:M23 family metallopeptidase [Chloroflexota bacterium]